MTMTATQRNRLDTNGGTQERRLTKDDGKPQEGNAAKDGIVLHVTCRRIRMLAHENIEDDDDAESMLVSNGRILAIGQNNEINDLLNGDERHIDYDGATIIPGLNESHCHLAWMGATWPSTMIGDPDFENPRLHSEEDREQAILHGAEILSSLGYTSATEPGIGPGEDAGPTGCFGSSMLRTYIRLGREHRLPLQVRVHRLFGLVDGASDLSLLRRHIEEVTDARGSRNLKVEGVKLFADGIPSARTAWLKRWHYRDGSQGDSLVRTTDGEDKGSVLDSMLRECLTRGMQVGVHATGDRSIESVVNAVARYDTLGRTRSYIIHGDMLPLELLHSMTSLGMAVTVQPAITRANRASVASALGKATMQVSEPTLHDLMYAGIPLCLSSDAPIATPDWRTTLSDAVALLGDDDGETLHRLLRAITYWPAWLEHADDVKGSLCVGRLADFTVLDSDPVASVPDANHVNVIATYVGGMKTFGI